jgi:hypothetical protein
MFPSPMLNEPALEIAVPQMKEYEGKVSRYNKHETMRINI